MKTLTIPAVGLIAIGCAGQSEPPTIRLGDVLAQDRRLPFGYEELSTNHAVVTLSVNGVDGHFIVDSGAGKSVVHADYLERFGITVERETDESEGAGAGGALALREFEVGSVSLEGHPLRLEHVLVTDLGPVLAAIKQTDDVDIHGILGQDVLRAHRGVIDIENDTMYLEVSDAS